MIESWKKVWRDAVAPILSDEGLEALRKALLSDDPRLIQGGTTLPPPMFAVRDWECEGACLIGYAYWQGDGLKTIGEVEEAFARTCFEADTLLGEPAGIRWLLNWFDETPRNEMRRLLLPEIENTRIEREHRRRAANLNYAKEL